MKAVLFFLLPFLLFGFENKLTINSAKDKKSVEVYILKDIIEITHLLFAKFPNEKIVSTYNELDYIYIITEHDYKSPFCNFKSNSIYEYNKENKSFKELYKAENNFLELFNISNVSNYIITDKINSNCNKLPDFFNIIPVKSLFLKDASWLVSSRSLNTILFFDKNFKLLNYTLPNKYDSSSSVIYFNGYIYNVAKPEPISSKKRCVFKTDLATLADESEKCFTTTDETHIIERLFISNNNLFFLSAFGANLKVFQINNSKDIIKVLESNDFPAKLRPSSIDKILINDLK